MKNFTKKVITSFLFIWSSTAFCLPTLNSFPSATATIYLDFDGEFVSNTIWNNGNSFMCEASILSDNQINEIFNSVAEDFRPFNVNITTDSSVYFNAPANQRIRVIITPTSAWKQNVGGISFIGSFVWGDNTPAFVFVDRLGYNVKNIAECCSHETGHTLGLAHQSKYDSSCHLIESYNSGNGNDQTSWAPIMGNSYGKNITGWNNGPIPTGCGNMQDNLSIITSANGFTFRNDDYSDDLNQAMSYKDNNSFIIDGIISNNTDKDVFKFTYTKQTNLHLEAMPYNYDNQFSSSNLDLKVSLYNDSQILIKTYNPSTLNISIDTILDAGTYYFILEGTGNENSTNYGSLGAYKFTGVANTLGINEVSLMGNSTDGKDNLSWNIIANTNIETKIIEISSNGIDFSNLINTNSDSKAINYDVNKTETRYYRLKVIAVSGEIAYSNMIALKTMPVISTTFIVPTIVYNQAIVTATENYKYTIFDTNGRIVKSGMGNNGTNRIEMGNASAGLYFIELFGTTKKEIKRIIKQ